MPVPIIARSVTRHIFAAGCLPLLNERADKFCHKSLLLAIALAGRVLVTWMEPNVGGRFAAIVGAPRCGTTSLARYLESHPAIDFSFVKEPHFFSQHDLTELDDDEFSQAPLQLSAQLSAANPARTQATASVPSWRDLLESMRELTVRR